MNPYDLNESITTLKSIRVEVYGTSDFAWNTVHHAQQYLEKQIAAYFAPEEIKEAA
jgi:hypothetical protein